MKVLLVKTSSMGDVIHTLPAITDASRMIPDLQLDWIVEEAFAEIPSWHPAVHASIPVALRRWRQRPLAALLGDEWKTFRRRLADTRYDVVVDAQGLLKSAFVSRLAHAPISGLDRFSAREPLASFFYNRSFAVAKTQHAIARTRQLFAQSLGYAMPETTADSGLQRRKFGVNTEPGFSVTLLHGTTREDKHWPDEHWVVLAQMLGGAGVKMRVPWYSAVEKSRAERIASASPLVEILPRSSLRQLAGVIAGSTAFVAVDTGLGHLAAALDVPGLSLYGPTDPARIGTYGTTQVHLKDTRMDAISPDMAFQKLKPLFPRAC